MPVDLLRQTCPKSGDSKALSRRGGASPRHSRTTATVLLLYTVTISQLSNYTSRTAKGIPLTGVLQTGVFGIVEMCPALVRRLLAKTSVQGSLGQGFLCVSASVFVNASVLHNVYMYISMHVCITVCSMLCYCMCTTACVSMQM